MNKFISNHCFWVLAASIISACGSERSDPDVESDSGPQCPGGDNGGGDTDTDIDTDIDTDTDGDTDTDTDTDTDSDTDADTDSDTDTDTDTDADSDSDGDPVDTKFPANLIVAADCEDVWEMLQDKFIDNMESKLEQNKNRMLSQLNECFYGIDAGAGGDVDTDTDSDSDSDGAGDYSETNTQVKGVDEADFLKNDGSHIYILADGKFQIIDAWPADQTHKISSTAVEGEPKKMFVHKDRAVVYSSLEVLETFDPSFEQYNSGTGECTYGYDCDFVGDGHALKVTVFDISDKAAPVLLRETTFKGSYLNSRRIDDAIYTLVVFPEFGISISGVNYWPEDLEPYKWECEDAIPFTAQEIEDRFESTQQANLTAIQDLDLSQFLPSVEDTRYEGGTPQTDTTPLMDCSDFYVSQAGDGMNLITLAAFDIDENGSYDTTSVVGRTGAVYASHDSLYLAARHYRNQMETWYYDAEDNIDEATTIHKFGLASEASTAKYAGSGVVKGRVLNQFSMSEYQHHLRIATTHGRVPNPNVHSTFSVLTEHVDRLEIIGQIDNIAPTEDIRSVRFNGDVGFIVTFKKTDPLFVLDLSDPYYPVIKGELKIPGFSTYMHVMDDDHILSIGYDAEDHDSFAYFQGIQLQILDVSNLADPQLMHKEIIGTRGSTSDATTNHLAFNYFGARNRLAIPMVICEESGGGGSYGQMTFSGLLVYETTVENGFDELGGIPHEAPDTQASQGACNNWWTESSSKVKRSVFMDDFVYSIAMDSINVSDVNDLEHPIATVDLVE